MVRHCSGIHPGPITTVPTGSCMLTLGTGERVENAAERGIQLLPAHCYAVVGE